LERVTLKHADYIDVLKHNYAYNDDWKALPQEVLIKFARLAPKLRWFCSDLTPENVAMLKEERPDVEFCNQNNHWSTTTYRVGHGVTGQ
jgi:hypothetical protein